MSVGVKGAAEIEALLKKLPDQVARRVVQSALRSGGTLIAKEAKAQLRSVDTGLLKSKIGVRGKKGKAQVGILSGGQTVTRKGASKPQFARPTKYAKFIEFGTPTVPANPFMRPALDAKSVEAIRKIGEQMGKGVEREALKMAVRRRIGK